MKTLRKEEIAMQDGELRIKIALRMGFKWAKMTYVGDPKPIRGLFLPEDGRWDSPRVSEWDGVEEVTIAADAYRDVPTYEIDPIAALSVQEAMEKIGLWMRVQSPWQPAEGDPWHAGFTPHGVTGWNGRPDFQGSGKCFAGAVCRAAVLAWEAIDEDPTIKELLVELSSKNA